MKCEHCKEEIRDFRVMSWEGHGICSDCAIRHSNVDSPRILVLGLGGTGWMVNEDIHHLHTNPYVDFKLENDQWDLKCVEDRFKVFLRIFAQYDRIILAVHLGDKCIDLLLYNVFRLINEYEIRNKELVFFGFEPIGDQSNRAKRKIDVMRSALPKIPNFLFSYQEMILMYPDWGRDGLRSCVKKMHQLAFERARPAFIGS